MPHAIKKKLNEQAADAPESQFKGKRLWAQRNALWLIALSPVAAQIVATIFNVLYNHFQIEPLLTEAQKGRFIWTVVFYNSLIYSTAGVLWIIMPLRIAKSYRAALAGVEDPETKRFKRDQRLAINLPWWFGVLAFCSWIGLIPVFLTSLSVTPDRLDYRVLIHLPISFVIGGLIGTTHGFFNVEFFVQRWLFPVLFRNSSPSDVPGATPLTLRGRSFLWVIAAVVCPIISILLLFIAPRANQNLQYFAVGVGIVAVLFAVTTAVMFYRWIAAPIRALQEAAHEINRGNLDTRIAMLRADEFGPMIDEFNDMTAGLREKEHIRETFGRHVGDEAARQILNEDPNLLGQEQVITVMFADLRGFTARSEQTTATETVQTLNVFLTRMVELIESHGGMVNKFLGDGMMAIFGAAGRDESHALQAVDAGRDMLAAMDGINESLSLDAENGLKIGIGIHTGPAVVGSIGAPSRRDFTAIGDTVNVASRIESLTKEVGQPLLFSEATFQFLPDSIDSCELEPRKVKGKSEPVRIFTLGNEAS